jgi:hypothetical protein
MSDRAVRCLLAVVMDPDEKTKTTARRCSRSTRIGFAVNVTVKILKIARSTRRSHPDQNDMTRESRPRRVSVGGRPPVPQTHTRRRRRRQRYVGYKLHSKCSKLQTVYNLLCAGCDPQPPRHRARQCAPPRLRRAMLPPKAPRWVAASAVSSFKGLSQLQGVVLVTASRGCTRRRRSRAAAAGHAAARVGSRHPEEGLPARPSSGRRGRGSAARPGPPRRTAPRMRCEG